MNSHTHLPKISEVRRKWREIDASQLPLGRLATKVSIILRGKDKPTYSPHMDIGDFVVVINAAKVKLTGRKKDQKEYIRFTGYPGGIRRTSLAMVLEKHPQRVVWSAVRGMLPTNKLRVKFLKRLKIVPGDKHNFKIDQKI